MSKVDLNKILNSPGDFYGTFRAPVPRKDLDELFKGRVHEKQEFEFLGCGYLIEDISKFKGDDLYDGPFKGSGILPTIVHLGDKHLNLTIGYYDDEYWDFAIGAAEAFILGTKHE